jgi:hypothetical protein
MEETRYEIWALGYDADDNCTDFTDGPLFETDDRQEACDNFYEVVEKYVIPVDLCSETGTAKIEFHLEEVVDLEDEEGTECIDVLKECYIMVDEREEL